MKKQLLILSCICLSIVGANAKITITSADVAIPGHIIYRATDTIHNSVFVGPAGASQTWSFGGLLQPQLDTLSFLAYGWMPNAHFSVAAIANVDSAGLVGKLGWQTAYSYMINSNTGLYTLGNYAMVTPPGGTPVPANQINTPSETLMKFPATINTTYTNNYTSFANFYVGQTLTYMGFPVQVDSARDHSITKKTVLIDSWGTLTTPLGIFNVIRSKETKITYDTSDVYAVVGVGSWHNNVRNSTDSTTSYVWWANGVGFPLCTATMDSTGGVKKVQWLKAYPATGINEYTAATTENVYPNPAENEINFIGDAQNQKAVNVSDVTGRLISTISITNNQTTINTSAFAKGLYTYNIIGKDNSIVTRGKFTISK